MKNKKTLLIGLLAVLLLGGIIVAANLDKRQAQTWQSLDAQQQMQRGSLYALERLLTNAGIANVENRRSMYGLSGLKEYEYGNGQLMIVADNNLESSEDAERLLGWVGRGNHLVLAMFPDADDNPLRADGTPAKRGEDKPNFRQTLLRRLQIGTAKAPEINTETLPKLPACVKAAERVRQAQQQIGTAEPLQVSERCNAGLSSVRLPENATLNIAGSYYQNGTVWVPQQGKGKEPGAAVLFQGKNAYGVQIVRMAYGDGSVLLTFDSEWLENPERPDFAGNSLALFDHAYLAVYLAQEKERILLVNRLYPNSMDASSPMLWQMIKAQPILWALAFAAALVLLWRIVVRVGVVQQLPPAPERYLKQHLLAQGQFLTRHLSRRAILNDMQRRLLEALQQRHPAWKQMGSRKQLEFLSAQTKLPPSVVEPWLKPLPDSINLVQWLQMLSSHQRIMRKINRSWY
ncbi:DUF4350 domain-containing protein [Eikenella sp. S3360]|uniref:DUF4350 domain-containing protein n=1 Tax=Eikenella glucosivorans TaxID=2766967 RepID=A0ABS0NB91_9NEIS|nr:DUF4350 domain-containing protein [Eikenella glucosivorans]MBH5329514.1 DUF4350 domain-containing protein [Eikenella glucosivorans]